MTSERIDADPFIATMGMRWGEDRTARQDGRECEPGYVHILVHGMEGKRLEGGPSWACHKSS